MSTTAKIAAKGTKGTGITEQLAAALHDNLGKTIVAIIELRSESRGENLKGDETVNLAIQTLEVIPEDVGAAEHVRELAKVAHYNRKLSEDGPRLQLPGDPVEPKTEDVLAAGKAYAPHTYDGTPSEDDPDVEICNVCGDAEDLPLHQVLDDIEPDEDQPDDESDEQDDDSEVDADQSGQADDESTEDPDAEPDAHEPSNVSPIGSPFATTR